MNLMNDMNYTIGILMARIFLGLLFFIQGYDKVFNLGIKKVANTFIMELSHTRIPRPLIILSAYATSWIELMGGLWVMFGFMKYYALYALGLDMLLVTIAMGLISPLWDTNLVFPRLVIVLLLLFAPPVWDLFSIDYLLSLPPPQ
jgi:putative oxidoreductase